MGRVGVGPLKIDNVEVQPYLIEDCAFKLTKHMMKTFSLVERPRSAIIGHWESINDDKRKPIKCPFGMLKKYVWNATNRGPFTFMKTIVLLVRAFLLLQNGVPTFLIIVLIKMKHFTMVSMLWMMTLPRLKRKWGNVNGMHFCVISLISIQFHQPAFRTPA